MATRWLRSGGLLAALFLLHSPAMEEDKTERKQAKDKRVFLWLRDDGAVNAQSHSAAGKVRSQPRIDPYILDEEIPNRLL